MITKLNANEVIVIMASKAGPQPKTKKKRPKILSKYLGTSSF